MKKAFLSLFLLSVFFSSKSQLLIHGDLEDVYRNFMVQAHTQFSKSILNDFLGAGGTDRFESAQWLRGGATNNFEVTISQNYLFNYDYLAHELHAKWRDTSIVVNTNYVKRFFLEENLITHTFVKSPVVDPSGKYFFESLAYDEPSKDSGVVQLLRLRTIKVVKNNRNDYLANFSGDYTDKMDNKIEYFIVLPNSSFTKVKINKSSISEALGAANKAKVDAFFKQASGKFTEEQAAALIRYINQK